MAMEGGTTRGYACKLIDGRLDRNPITALRSSCTHPIDVLLKLQKGETVNVAGDDVTVVAKLVEQAQKIVELELLVIQLNGLLSAEKEMRNGIDEL